MLHCKRIDISEEIDPTQSNKSKECMICHDWYFNHGFNLKILYAMVVMIWQICVLILAILLLSLLKILIIVVKTRLLKFASDQVKAKKCV